MAEYNFTELCPRVAMSIVFKYYWHVKQYRTQPLQGEVKNFYQHICNNPEKLVLAAAVAKEFFHNLLDITISRGNITVMSSDASEFMACVEQYVYHLSHTEFLLPNPVDLISREQIRILPFSFQVYFVTKLIRHLVENFHDHVVLLREVDLNDLGFGDYEKFCQEEVLIWLQMQGRLNLKHFAGVKDVVLGGKNQFIWLFNVELINQLRHGPFFMDYDREIINYNNQTTFEYTNSKGKPFAWGIVFRMLIEASGGYVTTQAIQQEFKSFKLELPVNKAVSELRKKFRERRIPLGYFPRATSGRGSQGYRLREVLPAARGG
jgi:hypothetical protein